jgi:hypothetical protein
LRPLRSEHESEETHDQRQQRDQGEEQLVGDRAGEERTLVGGERGDDGARVADDGPGGYQDAASLFGDGFSGAFVSVFLSLFVSLLVSLLLSLLVSVFVSLFLSALLPPPSSDPFWAGRLSVLYQPEPLKTIAGVEIRRRGFLPQFGHFSIGSSLYDCTAENTWPQ